MKSTFQDDLLPSSGCDRNPPLSHLDFDLGTSCVNIMLFKQLNVETSEADFKGGKVYGRQGIFVGFSQGT